MELVPGTDLNTFQRTQVRIRFNLWHLGKFRDFNDFVNAHHFWITKGGTLAKSRKWAVPNEDVSLYQEGNHES